jgi:hypothetical protein
VYGEITFIIMKLIILMIVIVRLIMLVMVEVRLIMMMLAMVVSLITGMMVNMGLIIYCR